MGRAIGFFVDRAIDFLGNGRSTLQAVAWALSNAQKVKFKYRTPDQSTVGSSNPSGTKY
jgi:hypothetical protein